MTEATITQTFTLDVLGQAMLLNAKEIETESELRGPTVLSVPGFLCVFFQKQLQYGFGKVECKTVEWKGKKYLGIPFKKGKAKLLDVLGPMEEDFLNYFKGNNGKPTVKPFYYGLGLDEDEVADKTGLRITLQNNFGCSRCDFRVSCPSMASSDQLEEINYFHYYMYPECKNACDTDHEIKNVAKEDWNDRIDLYFWDLNGNERKCDERIEDHFSFQRGEDKFVPVVNAEKEAVKPKKPKEQQKKVNRTKEQKPTKARKEPDGMAERDRLTGLMQGFGLAEIPKNN